MSEVVVKALLVPGLPHVLQGDAPAWRELRAGYERAGASVRAARPDALIIFSTQAIAVLGHMVQAFPRPKGIRVDENWYDFGDIPFDFPVDVELSTAIAEAANAAGLQAKLLTYDHYPIDTGTLVAQAFLNPDSTIPVSILACNIYAGRQDEETLGRVSAEAAARLSRRVAAVAVTGLSGGFYTTDIDPAQDAVPPDHDQWNRRILDLLRAGQTAAVSELAPEFAEATGADMQFKAYYWLMGAAGYPTTPARVHAYGPIWGSGAAVVEWDLA
jgi:2-aminophenol/2-amino-5-chlorophenol 1,6-dioxygenase alpha subunit